MSIPLRSEFTIDQNTVKLSSRRPVRWASCRVDLPVAPHDHEFTEICLVLKGHALHVSEQGSSLIGKNRVLIVPPGRVHGIRRPAGLEVLNLYFLSEWFLPELTLHPTNNGILPLFFPQAIFPLRIRPEVCEFDVTEKAMRGIQAELRDLDDQAKPLGWARACFHKALLLFVECYRARWGGGAVPLPTAVWRAMEEMDRAIAAGIPANFHSIAGVTAMTRDHLGRLFRRHVGETPMGFYQRRRIDFVCRLLLESDLRLSEIAARFGYADEAHMCRLFRRAKKLTPRGYREKFLSSRSQTDASY